MEDIKHVPATAPMDAFAKIVSDRLTEAAEDEAGVDANEFAFDVLFRLMAKGYIVTSYPNDHG